MINYINSINSRNKICVINSQKQNEEINNISLISTVKYACIGVIKHIPSLFLITTCQVFSNFLSVINL